MTTEFIYGQSARSEFGEMFGGWLLEHAGKTFLVDCGVGSGALDMVARLKKKLGSKPLDYLLLTHIHLDHAGGMDEIFETWPDAKAVAHQKGIKHLVDPEKLWVGTVDVMGPEVAEVYSRLRPIPQHRLIPHTEADLAGVTVFETPGHAPHHLSYRLGDVVFVGEAAGCPSLLGGKLYCQPATPPRYFPEVTHNSIRSLLELPDSMAYFGHTHYPMPLHQVLNQSLLQLKLWDDIFQRPDSALCPDENLQDYQQRLTGIVFQEDSNSDYFKAYTGIDLWRELYFWGNSIRGFVEHYAGKDLKPSQGGQA